VVGNGCVLANSVALARHVDGADFVILGALSAVQIDHAGDETLDLASGLVAPFAGPPASLVAAEHAGLLAGPTVNKLTLCNYITPAIVRATEHAAAVVPDLPHVFFTSGRDETIDKSLRMLRWHRKEGQVAIGLEGGYVGHTTAAARSLSDPRTHRHHPTDVHTPEHCF
jgi:adenosylmethionine-8-amino-7-oxononanoate aminotransferase